MLKGRNVASVKNSVQDAELQLLLKNAKIEIGEGSDKVNIVYFDSQKEAYAALQNETIDAASVYSPYASFFVTHDIDEAILLSDRIVMMSASPGRVYKEIPVPFARPRNRAELVQTAEYGKFRNELLSLFYSDIAGKIGGSEVVL
ncbi:MAG: hypothetical protein ACI4JT_03110 [Oscillospiraceae bacterium]